MIISQSAKFAHLRFLPAKSAKLLKFFRSSSRSLSFSNVKMSKTAILLLAHGAEEMEAVITADILRRADINVTICSITDEKIIKCSRGVNISTDDILANVKNNDFDAVILPGGLGGSENLSKSAEVGQLLKKQESANKVIAAICAAPTALKAHGIGLGKNITSYPSMKDRLTADYKYVDIELVVTDGNLITSRGPATAFAFGLAIVEKLLSKQTATKIAGGLLYKE